VENGCKNLHCGNMLTAQGIKSQKYQNTNHLEAVIWSSVECRRATSRDSTVTMDSISHVTNE